MRRDHLLTKTGCDQLILEDLLAVGRDCSLTLLNIDDIFKKQSNCPGNWNRMKGHV